jgi:hypothetical protein
MKTTSLLIVFCLFVAFGYSQLTPEACLGKIPSLPNNPCSSGSAEKAAYSNKVKAISAEIKADNEKFTELTKKNAEQNKDQMVANAMSQANMSNMKPEEIQKMIADIQETQRLTEEFRAKLADLAQKRENFTKEYEKEKQQRIEPIEKKQAQLRSNAIEANMKEAARLEDEKVKILNELCVKYTPQMQSYLADYLSILKTTGLPCLKIQDAQFTKTGISKIPLYIAENAAIAEYIEALADIFTFNVNYK